MMRSIIVSLCLTLTLFTPLNLEASNYIGLHGIERRSVPIDTGSKQNVALVLITSRDGFLTFCTATLYNPDTLLTDRSCAEESSEGFGTKVLFENAEGQPTYEVKTSIVLSKEKTGTDNEVGILILEKAVNDIEPDPLNSNSSLVSADDLLSIYSYGWASPSGLLATDIDDINLEKFTTQFASDDNCPEITDQSNTTNRETFCLDGNGYPLNHCNAENLGAPLYLKDKEKLGITGVLTKTRDCASNTSNSTTLSVVNIANPNVMELLIRYSGFKGRQSWKLQKDEGEQPIGYYDGSNFAHCVATIDDESYNGYYYDSEKSEESDMESSAMPSPVRGCVIFRKHSACITQDFSHVVGPVFAEWAVSSETPDHQRISFSGSSDSSPCVRYIGSTSVLGRWNQTSKVCEIKDPAHHESSLSGCSHAETPEQGNLIISPSEKPTGLLRQISPTDSSGRRCKYSYCWTSIDTAMASVTGTVLAGLVTMSIILLVCVVHKSTNADNNKPTQ